jgi:tRNA nucleotidyltransferase (CCA-adding enzyme)
MIIKLPNKIKYLIDLFYDAGFEAFAVGGCVRDSLLGKIPHDWDITTNAKPQQIKNILHNFKTIDTGIKYGTITLIYENQAIEITTYRTDLQYDDNRHPKKIEFTESLTQDLARRDFTINAMAYNDKIGLIDKFAGLMDLKTKIIRTVGNSNERFNEDGLRILRALRFAAQLNFQIEEETKKTMKANKNLLTKISGERINTEFTKILLSEQCTDIIKKYYDIIGVFIPDLPNLVNLQQNNPYHAYDVFEHTLKCLKNTPSDKIIRYAVLFHDFGKATTKTTDEQGIDHFKNHPAVSQKRAEIIMQRLKFSNHEIAQISNLVKYHDTPIICDEYHIKRWLKKFGSQFLKNLLEVKKADIYGQNPDLLYRLNQIPKYYNYIEKIEKENQCYNLQNLAINGNDLLQIGYKQNAKLGKVLNKLLDEVMKGNISNQKDILLEKAKTLKQ